MSDLRRMAEQAEQEPAGVYVPGGPMDLTPEGEGYAEPLDEVTYTSPILDAQAVPVHVAWSRVMADVKSIDKKSRADIKTDKGSYSFNFRGIDKVLNAVGPALRRHGVMVLPVKTVAEHNGAGRMRECTVTVTYRIYGPKGDFLETQGVGEGLDTGERATAKALTTCYRNMLIIALTVPTEDPKLDPDVVNVQREDPRPPTPIEYRDEVLNPRTAKTRMLQIRQELLQRGGHGSAMVPNEDGTGEISLLDLVAAVGRTRWPS